MIVLFLTCIELYYYYSIADKEGVLSNKKSIVYLAIGVLLANILTLPFITSDYFSILPFLSFLFHIIQNSFLIYYLLPLLPIFFIGVITIEYLIMYLAFKKVKFANGELFNTIFRINLLTSPIAIFLLILFANYLLIYIIISTILLISLESIFWVERINNISEKDILTTTPPKFKLICILSIANLSSILLGFLPPMIF
jgi:hypothetical protein